MEFLDFRDISQRIGFKQVLNWLNIPFTEKKDEIIEKAKEKYNDGKQEFIDGLSVEYNDWRFNLRKSNTEPLLRLNLEAKSREIMEQKKDEIIKLIESNR